MKDIIFKKDEYIFSYRVGAVLIHDGKILLQKVPHDDGFAFPGGHVAFGETSDVALCREIKEELHADIRIERLLMVGENFCPWGNLPCQQINLFYLVSLCDATQIPQNGTFKAYDEMGGIRTDLEMCWVSMDDLPQIKLYPVETKEIILSMPDEISYFVHHP
ncbi:MAG: NUDIX domain-containing protein [Oscillospiraceae bacterium]|nr:NUDIX domain-containing protein [Oscillospiraceae bacterium]